MKDTLIGWCHHTVNFWRGCSKVNNTECSGCYVEAQAKQYGWEFNVLRPTRKPWLEAELLNENARSNRTHYLVFTCSMSDFFHEEADPWRNEAWETIYNCKNLIWLVLTKRPENIRSRLPLDWENGRKYPNVWLGVTCGERKSFERVEILRQIDCPLRFISCEPLIEDISDLNLDGIGWVICGGMSGAKSVEFPMDLRWAANLYETARKKSVPFLFKQASGQKSERGVNALGLFMDHIAGKSTSVERDRSIREYPRTGLTFNPPKPAGLCWGERDWRDYLKTHAQASS